MIEGLTHFQFNKTWSSLKGRITGLRGHQSQFESVMSSTSRLTVLEYVTMLSSSIQNCFSDSEIKLFKRDVNDNGRPEAGLGLLGLGTLD